ncbi:MAG: TetR/AcrR family transcriptional regulator [Nocardioides sp.]|uniref:TetR/AcrR family transcriptional regulator n=1 Tax=Nocardioides sp. TaxID=35761 RepID=UPI003F0A13F6
MDTRRRQRAGGRSEQVREAVAHAVLDHLAEGRITFTTVEIAERAGVSRATIYRWWPTHAALLAEALTEHARSIEVPDTGSWSGDLRAFAHTVAKFAAAPIEVGLSRVMASGAHPDFNATVIDHYGPALTGWAVMVDRAVQRGEASTRHSATTVMNVLLAPLFLAPLTTGRGADPGIVDALVDVVLDATAPPD